MPTTSQKHRRFVREPMGHKRLTKVPGIGPKAAENLEENGITKAHHLYGKFLYYDMDEDKFAAWLERRSKARSDRIDHCVNALIEYSHNFL